MPDPLIAVVTAVHTVLNNDGTLNGLAPGGVWTGNAPDANDLYPYVSISLAAASDLYTFTRVYSSPHDLFIRAVDKSGQMAGAMAALARVYDLLNDQAVSVSGFTLQVLRRSQRASNAPVESGVQFQNLIDTYRVEVGI